ncbi:unnamed protein product [Eruca vesicaria subsp. sativa]|uniref:Uncharacterized protein n=1 Tax=Eruca vesicaria subsp. sativa TaxID=29727 RepID=A0ABC8JWG2_ERUVS|nr:unnamed protein product [Eruca vesicaria subsp. sativa]
MLVNNSGDSGCGVNAMEAVVGVQVEAEAVEEVATVGRHTEFSGESRGGGGRAAVLMEQRGAVVVEQEFHGGSLLL